MDKKKKDAIIVYSDDSQPKEYPAEPSTMDYFKEAFEPTQTRAQLEAIRLQRAKSQGS